MPFSRKVFNVEYGNSWQCDERVVRRFVSACLGLRLGVEASKGRQCIQGQNKHSSCGEEISSVCLPVRC